MRAITRAHSSQPSLVPGLEIVAPAFRGTSFEPLQDGDRLVSQLSRVEDLVGDGRPRSLPQIAAELRKRFPGEHFPEASISARLRDMRRRGWEIVRIRVAPKSGLYMYRAVKAGGAL